MSETTIPEQGHHVCPDCASTADRGGATREAALETPMATCPNSRHASWRFIWGIPEPEPTKA